MKENDTPERPEVAFDDEEIDDVVTNQSVDARHAELNEIEGREDVENTEETESTESTERVSSKTNDNTVTTGKKPAHKHSKLYMSIFVVVALLAGVMVWLFRDALLSMQTTPEQSETAVLKNPVKVTDNPELARFVTPTTGEAWLAQPKPMALQGWMKSEVRAWYETFEPDPKAVTEQMELNKPEYTEVGKRGDATIVQVVEKSGISPTPYLFEMRGDTVAMIVKPTTTGKYEEETVKWLKDLATDKVAVFDDTTHYDSLSVPNLTLKNGETIYGPEYATIDSLFSPGGEGVTRTLEQQLGASKLYRTERVFADTKLTNISYEIQLPLGSYVSMQYMPNSEDLKNYTFDNGKKATFVDDNTGKTEIDRLHAIARGCGSAGANVTRTDALTLSDMEKVGTTDTGRTVYQPKNYQTNSLAQKAYDEYKTLVLQPVSFDEFMADHGLLFMQNADKELLGYIRDTMGPLGGCAKPVVYLYPTKATTVNVQVGANVTVSDPQYEPGGWRGVVAQPDGTLSYRGQQYSSLFWEGQAFGAYPGIASGTVVKRADAPAIMRKQLAQQGLNTKEIADFMAFWESKIPEKPYIRLTWFGTAVMERLAPLKVSPQPDTILRVFLDMDGFDQKPTLPAQTLTNTKRSGFTVVEWGGLTTEGLR
ncbi:MAG: hypothetical protein ACM3MA_01455 [Acidobacteriota bacterium]